MQKQAVVDKAELEVQAKQAKRDEAQAERQEPHQVARRRQRRLTKLNTDLDLREKALAKLDPTGFSAFKKQIMEWPIINGFNSPLKITQDWLPNLTIQLGMARTARFDRCRTCHARHRPRRSGQRSVSFPFGHPERRRSSDMVLREQVPAIRSQRIPNPDLYLSATSPHPLQKFGCTICHDGQGSGTSFKRRVAHAPTIRTSTKCGTRSITTIRITFGNSRCSPSGCASRPASSAITRSSNSAFIRRSVPAPRSLYKGYNLIKEYGCFGCHEIQGFDGTRPIGPDLRLEPSTEAEAAKIAADPTQIAGNDAEGRPVAAARRHEADARVRQLLGRGCRSGSARPRGCPSSSTPRTSTTRWPTSCSRSRSWASPITSPRTPRTIDQLEAGRGLHARCRCAARISSRSAAASPVTATRHFPIRTRRSAPS